ncbi:MAG: glycerate kinase [Enterocloster clostridioformis]
MEGKAGRGCGQDSREPGAAGGLGAAFCVFLKANLKSGIDIGTGSGSF